MWINNQLKFKRGIYPTLAKIGWPYIHQLGHKIMRCIYSIPKLGFRFGMTRKARAGLTLIEILLVTAMLSVVSLALYATFDSGLKIWQRLTRNAPDQEVNIFLARLADDLRSSFGFSGIQFSGSPDEVSFATFVIAENPDNQKVLTVGQVGYLLDDKTDTLNRWQADYSMVAQEKRPFLRPMLTNVRCVKFEYYYFHPQMKVYAWADDWEEAEDPEERKIPQAVRIEIGFDQSVETKNVTKTISIPAGG